jgi:hypothetical protein
MSKLLRRRLTTQAMDQTIAWVVAWLLLVVCTTLVLKMLPLLDLRWSLLLVFSVSAGWLVLAWLSPLR